MGKRTTPISSKLGKRPTDPRDSHRDDTTSSVPINPTTTQPIVA